MSSSSDYNTVCHEEGQWPVQIAVMGPTGTGKTSFINLLSGSELRIGRQLESCTSEVQIARPFDLDGRMITLIDTPGFDDTNLSATSVLSMIAAYMALSYDHGNHLAGVIYMHRILDNRMGGISARSFRLFRSLCGEESLNKVIIATTMWDQVEVSIGEEREKELVEKEVFFKPAVEKGARIARHNNTLESAQTIIRTILAGYTMPITLKIQEELHQGIGLADTQVGKEVNREIFEQIERHREEMRGMLADIQEATRMRDDESRKELIEERAKTEAIIHRLQEDSANAAKTFQNLLSNMEERLRTAERIAVAARLRSQAQAQPGNQPSADGAENSSQQTHSPTVQAVAATENSNAVLEGKLAAAIPVVGFWGKLSVMLAPFSLTWR